MGHLRPEGRMHSGIISILLSDAAFEICSSNFESVRKRARITPYPTRRLFWGALSQALRAWLRSCCPSGTKIHSERAFLSNSKLAWFVELRRLRVDSPGDRAINIYFRGTAEG